MEQKIKASFGDKIGHFLAGRNLIGIGVIVALISGSVLGFSYGKGVANSASLKEKTKIVERVRDLYPIARSTSFIARVTGVENGRLLVEVDPTLDPFAELSRTRRIIIADSTTLIRLVAKSGAKYEKET